MNIHAAHLTNRMALASRMADEIMAFQATIRSLGEIAVLPTTWWNIQAQLAGSSRPASNATIAATVAILSDRGIA